MTCSRRSGAAAARSSVPSLRTSRSAPPHTYAIKEPSGDGRGSTTWPAVAIRRGAVPSVRTTHNSPRSAKEAIRTSASVAYDTTPDDISRARSRRVSSS